MSDPTQISRLYASDSNSGFASEMESYLSSSEKPSSFSMGLKNVALVYQDYNLGCTQSLFKKSSPLPFGLHNMATSYQTQPEGSIDLVLSMPLKGA